MTAYLRGDEIENREALHRALAWQLDFPDYYGRNLDALYDVLTSVSSPVRIIFSEEDLLREHLGGYYDLLRSVLEDVCEQNENVSVSLEDPPESEGPDAEAWGE